MKSWGSDLTHIYIDSDEEERKPSSEYGSLEQIEADMDEGERKKRIMVTVRRQMTCKRTVYSSSSSLLFIVQPVKQEYTCKYTYQNIHTMYMLFSSQPAEAYDALSSLVV